MINTNNSIEGNKLIFFKEDILKDMRQFESQITAKFNSELDKNNEKLLMFQTTLNEMTQKLEKISSNIISNINIERKANMLNELFSKLEQTVLLHEEKIKNTNIKLTETIDKFNELYQSVIYPTVIGPTRKYKTFHEFIDFIVVNLNNLLFFKEKLYTEFKNFKAKADSNINDFKIKLEYQGKNSNAFTSASIRASEEKMRKAWNDTLKNELDIINKKFEVLTKPQEDRILFLIENSEIIKIV